MTQTQGIGMELLEAPVEDMGLEATQDPQYQRAHGATRPNGAPRQPRADGFG